MKLLGENQRKGLLWGVLMVLLASVLLFTGCGSRAQQTPEGTEHGTQEQVQQENTQTQNPEQTGYRTGLSIETSMHKSLDAGEGAGTAQVDTLAVAVLLDEEGRIVDCSLDMLEASMAFSNTGEVITPLDQSFQTKKELGDAYGMKAASGIGKEEKT